ncbi:hypothetical protein [Gracilibacillus thailandensis]|uniref:Uncharacterized protein n=1 Tax=Gracilibacillus thailandensis TaxID=563735 RepID=A0A6N7R2W9_9BACI|nr:hypothetical protein [Gracilibacillus thailandensis]
MYVINMVMIVMIIGYCGIRVAEGSRSTGSLVAFLLFTTFAMFFTQLQKAQGATERIMDILVFVEESKQGKDLDISNLPISINRGTILYMR